MIKDISHKIPAYSDILYDVFSFVGGVNARTSELFLGKDTRFSLKKDQTRSLINMLRTQSGALITRPGRAKLNASAVSPAAGDAVIRSVFELSTATSQSLLINAGNGIFKWNGTSFVSQGTVATNNRRVLWCQFKDKALGINGTDTMVSYDGTTLSTVAGAPVDGSAIASHRGRVWILRGRGLSYCGRGDETDWSSPNNAGFLPVPTTRGRGGTALISLWDRLLIFTEDQVFQLFGTSPDDFQILPLNLQYGHKGSPYGVLAAGNDVYYVNKRGTHSLSVTDASSVTGDVSYAYTSGQIEPLWQQLNAANLDNIIGIHDSTRNLLILLCSRTGVNNTECFVADYYHLDETGQPTWSTYSGMPFASGAEVSSLNGYPEVLFGSYDGYVYRQVDNSMDDGVPFSFELSYVTDLDLQPFDKLWRHLVIFATGIGATISGNVTFDFGSTATNFQLDLNTAGGDTIGSTFTIGTSALGTIQMRPLKVSIPGHGRLATITLTGSVASQIIIGGFLIYAGVRRLVHN